jgi:aspartate aminotransferase
MAKRDLADRLQAIEESVTLALNARAKQLAAEGRAIFNLTAGELASDTPEFIQKYVAQQLDKNKYTPVAGLPKLRTAIADHSRDYYGLNWIKANNVVVTGGAKPALYATFLALINPGDEVIVPTPAWVSYVDLIRLVGGVVVEVPLTASYDLDVPAIKAKLTPKTRAIIVNSPHNPTGAIFSQKAVHGLSVLLKDRNVTVVADDIYCRLVFDKSFVPVPKAGFDHIVIINGFSKSQALTGWRIGYLIADDVIVKAAASLLSHINGNAPLPSQYAGLAAMSRRDKPPASTLATLQKQREIVIAGLQNAGIKHNLPGGAFYIFLDLRHLTDDSTELCEQLLNETGVALVPGEAFSAPGFARLTFVADEKMLVKALDQIKLFVDKGQAL